MGAMLCSGFLLSLISGKFLILFGLLCVGVSNLWMTGWNVDVGIGLCSRDVGFPSSDAGFGSGLASVDLCSEVSRF